MPTAYQYCTGAVVIYAAPNFGKLYNYVLPSPGAALLLGTCEQYPLVEGDQQWSPTWNDIAGDRPFDKQYFGDAKVLVLDINKMVQENIDSLIDVGVESNYSRGQYKNLQSPTLTVPGSFTVWLLFTNYGSPAAVPGLPPGEIYFNCNISRTGYDPIGTRSRKTRLVVESDPSYAVNAASLGISTYNGFITYSNDPVFFSGLPVAA